MESDLSIRQKDDSARNDSDDVFWFCALVAGIKVSICAIKTTVDGFFRKNSR